MKKLQKMCVMVATSATLPIAAMASTVAYWPLAGENGVWTTQGDVFQNSISPGTMDAVSTVIRCRDGAVAPTSGVHAKDYPAGTNAFPVAYGVYDPVAKANHTAATGLDFGRDSFVNNWNTSHSCCWIAGALRVADPDALKLSTFTVEFFVKPDPAYKSREQVIAAMPLEKMTTDYTSNKASWSIGLDGNGRFYATFSYTNGTTATTGTSDAVPLFDDRWHHIAVTVSGTAVKLFFDYRCVRSVTLAQNVNYAEDGDLFMGGTTHAKFSYAGSLAHFRVSDEALTGDKFLHFTRLVRAADEPDDVALHLDFEPVDGISTNKTVVFNRAATGSAVHLHTNDNYAYDNLAVYDEDVYTNKLYASRKDFKGNDNLQSFSRTGTPSNNSDKEFPYLSWFPDDDIFHDYSFTVEMFLKTSESGTYKPFLRSRTGTASNAGVQLTFGTGGTAGKLNSGFNSYRIADTQAINDGTWHHLSLVYDKTASKVRLFRDWGQVGSDKDVTADVGTASENPIVILGDPGDSSGSIAKIDEVRITKRALTKREFLTPDKAKGLIIMFQ